LDTFAGEPWTLYIRRLEDVGFTMVLVSAWPRGSDR
jgi:hypothetical protein